MDIGVEMRVKITTIVKIDGVVVSEDEVITEPGGPALPIEPPPDEEPTKPDTSYITKVAQSSRNKPHILLYVIAGYNEVSEEDGGPYPIMRSQLLDERIKILNGELVAMINFEQRVDNGATMFEVVGYGAAIGLKSLEGKKLYIDKVDLR